MLKRQLLGLVCVFKPFGSLHSFTCFHGEAWKWDLRKKVWNFLEDNDLADFPRPVHHRIPNFKESAKAGERLAELPEFINAKVVKVNPDTPQKSVRVAALRSEKSLDSFNRYGMSV